MSALRASIARKRQQQQQQQQKEQQQQQQQQPQRQQQQVHEAAPATASKPLDEPVRKENLSSLPPAQAQLVPSSTTAAKVPTQQPSPEAFNQKVNEPEQPKGTAAPAAAGVLPMKKGFLAQAAGALYPDGSRESAPACWRGSAAAAQKVFALHTADEAYEVVGHFPGSGHYLGKEDFEVVRTGLQLRIRGNPQKDELSLVSGLDETIDLHADSDFEAMTAEFTDSRLRIRIPRRKGPITVELTPEMVKALQSLSTEERASLSAEPSAAALLRALRLDGNSTQASSE